MTSRKKAKEIIKIQENQPIDIYVILRMTTKYIIIIITIFRFVLFFMTHNKTKIVILTRNIQLMDTMFFLLLFNRQVNRIN